MTFWNLFDCLVYSFCRAVCDDIIAFRDHSFDIFIWYSSIQNDGIPVLFILVVTCDHGIIRRPPEVTPLRIYLDIQIDISVFFVDPEECFLTFLHAHQLPVLVFKRAFLIYIFKG